MAKWYIRRNDKQSGPFESAQLKQLAADGKIKPNDQIRRDDQESWHKAESVKGLFLAPKQTKDVPSEAMRQADASQASNAETKSDDPTSSGRWFISRNGKEAGPFEMQQLVAFAASGRIKVDDLVRKDGESLTKKASELKELFQATSVEPAVRDESPMSTEPANDEAVESEAVSKPKKTKDWFYQIEGEEIGPVSFKKICHLYKTGKIDADDLIAQEGMNWIEAGIFLEPAVVESAVSVDEWFIIGSDQNLGPYTFSHLQGLFENKEISESSLIGRRGSKGTPVIDFIPVDSGSFYDRMRNLLLDNSSWDLRVFAAVIGIASALTLRIVYVAPLYIQLPVFCVAALISYLKMHKWRNDKESSVAEVSIAIRKKATWIAGSFVAIAVIMWLIPDFDYYPFQYIYVWTCIILVLGLPATIYKSSLLDSWYMNVLEIVVRFVASHILFIPWFIIIAIVSDPTNPPSDEESLVIAQLSFACSSITQALIPFEWLPLVILVLLTIFGQMSNDRSVGICPRCRGRGLCYTCRGAGCSQCHPLLPGKCSDCDGTGGTSVLLRDSGVPRNTGAR